MDRRFLLDTNIALFAIHEPKELERQVKEIVDDCYHLLYISTISVQEMIHLVNGGKFGKKWKSPDDVLPALDAMGCTLLPLRREHLETYAKLRPIAGHNDPFDHIIISQAISEQMALVSSDHKFFDYTTQKLKFIFNER
ncbi:twitching motility protein PilT [Bacteroidia bacterium]|nr:twitching motility protein PilT [Bacteroidia bacterium]